MKKRQIKILAEQVENEFLPVVRRPSRYIGGEINQIKKDLSKCGLTVAICFPDVYEVGMSYTGLGVIYDILNGIEDVAAERVFAPWIDAEKILREKKIPLFSLESKASLASFDVVGFSLTCELCYSNVLNMLDLAGINIRSSDRSEDEPLVIAGGIQTACCEPMAEFIDLFVLGDGEETVVELVELIKDCKKTGVSKKDILRKAVEKFEWVYVPAIQENCKKRKNAIVEDFENAPAPMKPIVPFAQAVHERVSIEIMRGCPGRCRFCQAGFYKRPVRYRSVEKIVDLAKANYAATGFDTVSLLSLSSADYPKLEELVTQLQGYFADKHVGLSVPSLRVDKQLKIIPKLLSSVRKSGLTIAVEAASERLRQIINKPLEDEDLFAAAESAYAAGWQKLKLYFMVGLPGEIEEDIKQIVHLSCELAKLRKKTDGKTAQINITVSWFVPKPHTPFGWLGQREKAYFENAKKLILDEKRRLNARFLQFKFHNIDRSILESAMERGDRRLSDVIEEAWKTGARFDLWDECFDYQIWQKAFVKFEMDVESQAQKAFGEDAVLPWEHLGGPEKKHLLKHLDDAKSKTKKIC